MLPLKVVTFIFWNFDAVLVFLVDERAAQSLSSRLFAGLGRKKPYQDLTSTLVGSDPPAPLKECRERHPRVLLSGDRPVPVSAVQGMHLGLVPRSKDRRWS